MTGGRVCGASRSSVCELWLLHGGHSRQLIPRAFTMLIVPRATSANGNRLIVDYAGPAVRSVAVQLSPRSVRALATIDTTVGAGISRDGQTLLLDRGDSAAPPHDGLVETVPFGGGQPTRIASGDSAAWNG